MTSDLFPETIEEVYERAIKRIVSAYELSMHMGKGKLWVCFSGGKDSVCVYGVCKMASERLGIDLLEMCEFHYNITNVDPPELVTFIKKEFPFVSMDMPKETMWQLIEKKGMPPTRIIRYCCSELKERGGRDRFCVTGVRWAESVKRRKLRGVFEKTAQKEHMLFSDNEEGRRELEHCIPKGKFICNPIVDWSDEQVWEFIKSKGLPYCKLYDEGFNRLGCIGCPNGTSKQRRAEFERYPRYKEQYLRTFHKMLVRNSEKGVNCTWETPEEVMEWWLRK